MHAHFSRNVSQYLVAILQFYLEHGVGQWLHYLAFYFNYFFFGHAVASTSLSPRCVAVIQNRGNLLYQPAVVQGFPASNTPSHIFEIH